MEKGSKYITFLLSEQEEGRRLDSLLKQLLGNLSTSSLYKALRKGDIKLNNKKSPPEVFTKKGDELSIYFPLYKPKEDPILYTENFFHEKLFSWDYPNPSILYEDKDFIIINKEKGLIVTPENEKKEPSLKDWILSYLEEEWKGFLTFKPSPLHRLDRNTTGALVFSRSLKGAQLFSEAMRDHLINKKYLAILEGDTPSFFEWRDFLMRDKKEFKTFPSSFGKEAITLGEKIATFRGRTLVSLTLKTGLTHQIRASSSFHEAPLLGDIKYGGSYLKTGYFLHAYDIDFLNIKIQAPLPFEFKQELEKWELPLSFKKFLLKGERF